VIYSLFMQSMFVDELGVIIGMIWLDLSYIDSVSDKGLFLDSNSSIFMCTYYCVRSHTW
jgi:hypothetical protein